MNVFMQCQLLMILMECRRTGWKASPSLVCGCIVWACAVALLCTYSPSYYLSIPPIWPFPPQLHLNTSDKHPILSLQLIATIRAPCGTAALIPLLLEWDCPPQAVIGIGPLACLVSGHWLRSEEAGYRAKNGHRARASCLPWWEAWPLIPSHKNLPCPSLSANFCFPVPSPTTFVKEFLLKPYFSISQPSGKNLHQVHLFSLSFICLAPCMAGQNLMWSQSPQVQHPPVKSPAHKQCDGFWPLWACIFGARINTFQGKKWQ